MSVAALHHLITRTIPARPVAVARIMVGAVALGKAVDIGPTALSLLQPGVLRAPYASWMPETPLLLGAAGLACWVAAAVGFLVGWRTRLCGAVLTGSMAFVLLIDQQLYGNHLYLLIILCLLLTISGSGAALAFDAREGGREVVPAWPITLLKFQLTIVYGFAGVAKLNAYFLTGAVLNVHWIREGIFALPDGLRRWELLFPLALFTVVAEIFLALALWSPRLRDLAFVFGFGLHLAMIATMGEASRLALFAMLMFSLYLLFLEAEPRSRVVVWDDSCTFCARCVRWFQRLDWLRVHSFVGSSEPRILDVTGLTRAEADEALYLVAPDSRRSGFAAVRAILEVLPVSFLWAPLFRLPPLSSFGEYGYRYVAARRRCVLTPAEAPSGVFGE